MPVGKFGLGGLTESFHPSQLPELKMKNDLPSNPPEFSFDDLSLLANANPEAFEKMRLALINSTIQFSGENSSILTALQSRLDQEISGCTTSYVSCLCLSQWINESYQKLTSKISSSAANTSPLTSS